MGQRQSDSGLCGYQSGRFPARSLAGQCALANCTIRHFSLQVMEACLAEGVVTERGALPTEACLSPEPFFRLLAERNLPTTVTIKRAVVGVTGERHAVRFSVEGVREQKTMEWWNGGTLE